MQDHFAARATKTTRPITPLSRSELKRWLRKQRKSIKNWVGAVEFAAKAGESCLIPASDGKVERVLLGVDDTPWCWAGLPKKLPKGRYYIDAELTREEAERAALGWALGTYRFSRYKQDDTSYATLVWPAEADADAVTRIAEGIFLGRDLINTPAEDMGPEELADAARALAKQHRARCTILVGDKLLKENYPTIHTVGRASSRAPRLIDIRWGKEDHPKLTLVGKGVCFDSGGLDLKTAAGMKLMKKDMGGAATVLGLAHAIMSAGLRVRLRVLVPAVENSVSGNAFRPMDIIRTRKGLTVEVGNTDAEGRLILCDALTEADSEEPDLIIDVATLTGAARIALGTKLPALFSSDDGVADDILSAGSGAHDPLWRLPLHSAYRDMLKSSLADTNNVSAGGYGGAITAALFLQKFVSSKRKWVHIDTMAYNLDSKAGRPAGGEPMGLRALFAMLERRYPPAETAPA